MGSDTVTEDTKRDAPAPESGGVQSLQRGIQILELVIHAGEPLRLMDIARHFDIDRASAFRFLQTLERSGLVSKDPKTKSYTVGGKLLQWAATLGDHTGLVATVRPYLQKLVEATNESAHFGVLSNDHALLLDYIASRGMIVVQNRVGVFEPLYCTALGKALLAHQPRERRDAIVRAMDLARHTPNTVVDRERIGPMLDAVVRDGIALDDAEYNDLLYCVAAPVFGIQGTPIGAIGVSMVHALAVRDPARIRSVAAEVRHQAQELSEFLAGSGAA